MSDLRAAMGGRHAGSRLAALGCGLLLAAALPAAAADAAGGSYIPTPYIPSTTLAAGKWRLVADLPAGARDFDFELQQSYQRLRGGARVPGGYLPAFEAKLEGDRIAFVLVDSDLSLHFEGRVAGPVMEGVVRSGPGRAQVTSPWRATRVGPMPEEG